MSAVVEIPHRPVTAGTTVLRLRPAQGWAPLRLGELWEYRELLYFLVWRDVKVRYKQTALGAAWAILQPLCTMLVFSLFLGRLAKMPSDGIPYPLFTYAALVPWTFFATGLSQASDSLVGNANLVRKVYFPRLAVPIGATLAGIVDLLLATVVLVGMELYYGWALTPRVLWMPLFLLLCLATSLGAGLWLSALNVHFRDVKYVVPFLIQFWMFATPIVYPSSLLPQRWRSVYGLNPMAGVVEGFRWSMLNSHYSPGPVIAGSAAAALVMLVGGLFIFRRMERTFADLV
ncbi:MAG: ABC transporter permease [Acidobacteriia bacterium]|nr:ABC transporter permease [Terriglobia bacterium]